MPNGSSRLRQRRRELGLSIRQIEDRSEVSNAYISQIESGKRPSPHPNILKKLAPAYELSIEDIMKMFGYLNNSEEEKEEMRIDRLIDEARRDPEFSFGHRLRGQLDPETKKVIARLYEKVKSQRGEQ